MKKFLLGALTAAMLWSFGSFTQAEPVEQNYQCCYGNYCAADNDDSADNYGGEYCGRYGCRR